MNTTIMEGYRSPAKKRIVFLDVDGPFVTMRSTAAGLKSDPVSVNAVNEFLKLPNTYVVISSVERMLKENAEDMGVRLKDYYGLEIPTFHPQWRTGRSCKLRQQEIKNWLDENGMEPDTDYIAVDDDPVDLEGVFHVRASYDGILTDQLLLLMYLRGKLKGSEHLVWKDCAESKMRQVSEITA